MGEETWTYEQAGRLTHRVANGLLSLGLEREAKVAVLSPNSPASWLCVLGIWRAGAAWVPLNPGNPVADTTSLRLSSVNSTRPA
ncbi:AMP-binding protein [Gordonia phthalatica]|uniref:AMP-binding protein n=1 Tax=Gordonia phthalatica TaxID=1136941 RepID=UPI001F2CF5E3|nr:AMP-binding protein [Gordonia phthalatica]